VGLAGQICPVDGLRDSVWLIFYFFIILLSRYYFLNKLK
jgi:hypothetical protein